MANRAVIQPNGLYARFSEIVDHFTDYNCTREELRAVYRDEYGESSAEGKLNRADESGLERFEESIRIIEAIHGKPEAEKIRLLLGKAKR